jgi:hypothetical protein
MVAHSEYADERARLLTETDGAADLIAGFAPTYNAGVDDVWAHPPREPRFDVRRVVLGLQPPPLWWAYPHIWRRQGWVFESIPPDGKTAGLALAIPNMPDFPRRPWFFYDRRRRRECIANLRRQERQAATAAAFPSQIVLTREMLIAELELAYALLWRWPDGGNETETGVLDYTILRLLDWTPDATPATALAKAFDTAGWSRARYARAFEDRQHFVNWLRKETRFYAKSLGRSRTMIPAMHDDVPIQFKDDKVALLGEKVKSAALVLFKGERHLTEPTIDIWDAITEVRPCDDGERYDGLPSRATGRAARRGRRWKPGEVTRVSGGDVAGRQTLAERYGENIRQRQLQMVDRALDDMEQERQRDAEIPRKFAGRYNDNVPGGFARDDISDASGAAPRAASGTRRARGAAAARAVVERVQREIAFREWLNTVHGDLDAALVREDLYAMNRDDAYVVVRTVHHWGNGAPHEDLAAVTGLRPEVVRARLALAFEGLRLALGYEPTSRRKVEDGLKDLPISSDVLDAVARVMVHEAEVVIPSTKGGRPRKMSAQVAAERMRYAARLLSIIEIAYEAAFVTLEGAAPPPDDLNLLVKPLVDATELASASLPNTNPPGGLVFWEVVDALEAVKLRDRDREPEFQGRPGGAARFAIGAAFWGAYRKGVDLERLLQEYFDRAPRPLSLARAPSTPEPDDPQPVDVVTIRRHAADIRLDFRTALRQERTRFKIFLGTVGEPA